MARLPAALLLTGLLGACATASAEDSVGASLQQPLRDLNVVRSPPAEVVARARQAPYAPPAEPACPAIARELAELEAALGPDIDARDPAQDGDGLATQLATDAIGDLIGLPYRGIVRRVTGAERRDREARAQKLAGNLRRAFLKGWSRSLNCPPAGL